MQPKQHEGENQYTDLPMSAKDQLLYYQDWPESSNFLLQNVFGVWDFVSIQIWHEKDAFQKLSWKKCVRDLSSWVVRIYAWDVGDVGSSHYSAWFGFLKSKVTTVGFLLLWGGWIHLLLWTWEKFQLGEGSGGGGKGGGQKKRNIYWALNHLLSEWVYS